MRKIPRPVGDTELVQIVDASLLDAASRAGEWLACRPGCAQCCHGAFRISQLDVARIQTGVRNLELHAPERLRRMRRRADEWISRNETSFPGSLTTGLLHTGDAADAKFEEFANDDPCPALDPATSTCDIYEYRPMTCRVFGPPVRSEGGLGVCELCFQGATDDVISACEMIPDPEDLESKLLSRLESEVGGGETVVAFVLLPQAGTLPGS